MKSAMLEFVLNLKRHYGCPLYMLKSSFFIVFALLSVGCSHSDGYDYQYRSVSGYWENGIWTTLTNGVDAANLHGYMANALVVDASSNVYVGGYCWSGSYFEYAGYWKNGEWTTVNGSCGFINALVVDSSGNIFAGGRNNIWATAGYWKNGMWSELECESNLSADDRHNEVTSLALDVSEIVYAGGYSCTRYGDEEHAEYWRGGVFAQLPNGVDTANSRGCSVNALAIDSSGSVYCGGYSRNSSGVEYAGYWKDGVWTTLIDGVDYSNSRDCRVNAIVVDAAGNCYAGGFCTNMYSGSMYAGYWKNGEWTTLVNGVDPDNSMGCCVNSLSVDLSGNVYAGGYCGSGSYRQYPGYWKNGIWTTLTNNSVSADVIGAVTALAVDSSGNIFAGGFCHN